MPEEKRIKDIETSLQISTTLHHGLIDKNTRLIIFDTNKFKNIIFNPMIINNKISLSFVNDQKYEIHRKIRKLDKIMK